MRQTNIAARETMQVSKNVTNMTQTPYAFPRDVVYFWLSEKGDGCCVEKLTLL